MTNEAKTISKAPRERSPGFPFISLRAAVQRVAEFDKFFGRHPTPADKVGQAWGMKGNSSQAQQTIAALKYFGLIDYKGSGQSREAFLTEDARNYLRANQDHIKQEILKRLALKPKEIAKFWIDWRADRPIDEVCLDILILKSNYNDKVAPHFIKVYDDTIAFAGLENTDKIVSNGDDENDELDNNAFQEPESGNIPSPPPPPSRIPQPKGSGLMEGERIIFTEEETPQQHLRLIAAGELNDYLLEALEDFVKRQRKRLSVKKEVKEAFEEMAN